MPTVFTITSPAPQVFTATIAVNPIAVTETTSSFTIVDQRGGFTVTQALSSMTVINTNTTQVVNTQTISMVTATRVNQTIGVVQNTVVNVAVDLTAPTIAVANTSSKVEVVYNPTIVEHVYDGQPVYSTSSPTFRTITLGDPPNQYTFPTADGTSTFALLTDGDGNLYWGPTGGGLGFWSLNSDLLTNGFKIDSGSSTVELSIVGGGSELLLDDDNTHLNSGVGEIKWVKRGTTSTYWTLRNVPSPVDITMSSTNIAINAGYLKTLNVGQNYWDADRIYLGAKTSTGTVTVHDRLEVGDSVKAYRLLTNQAALQVPPLMFPDGSVLVSANQIGTGTTATIYSLQDDLYTNGFYIRASDSRASLNLEQGLGSLTIENQVGYEQAKLVYDQNNITIDADKLQLNHKQVGGAGRGAITLANYNSTQTQVLVTATNVKFNTTLPVEFTAGIKFPDGTIQDTASTGTGGVSNILAGDGIRVDRVFNQYTIWNTGVRAIVGDSRIVVNTSSGIVYFSLGPLPITAQNTFIVTTNTVGSTLIGFNYPRFYNSLIAGNGVFLTSTNDTITIGINTQTFASQLSGDLLTKGFAINGESNSLLIESGKRSFLGSTLSNKISMPFNSTMTIYSDYGIAIDTPDDKPVQILSPFTLLHRNGQSRFSTDAQGLTRINDTVIAVTATNRVQINESVFSATSVLLATQSTSTYISLGESTATIASKNIKVASTGTFYVGADIYRSKLGVQSITNYNETSAPTFPKGIQFADLTVQRTAYAGNINLGAIAQPALNPTDFIIQTTNYDFGTVLSPSTLSYDGGVI